MPTVLERLATLEEQVANVETTTTETKGDVKALLTWRDEERGFRRAEAAQRKRWATYFGAALAVVTIALNVLFKVI